MTSMTAPAPSAPSNPSNPPARDLPKLTMRQLTFRVERLCRMFRLNEHDRSDLEGEAACEVLKALVRYDAALASKTTYARGALDLWYAQKCKQLRRDGGRASRQVPLPGAGSERDAFQDRHQPTAAQRDLQLDMADRLSRLPGDLGALARELQSKSVSQIAADRGVHRGTVHRLVLRLRVHFADLNPAMN